MRRKSIEFCFHHCMTLIVLMPFCIECHTFMSSDCETLACSIALSVVKIYQYLACLIRSISCFLKHCLEVSRTLRTAAATFLNIHGFRKGQVMTDIGRLSYYWR